MCSSPFWGDVGIKKWSRFFCFGPRSAIFCYLKTGTEDNWAWRNRHLQCDLQPPYQCPCPRYSWKKEEEKIESCLFPVDCNVGPWGSWTSCSLTCGGGSKNRTRCNQLILSTKNQPIHLLIFLFREKKAGATNNGTKCASARMIPLAETNTCNDVACPSTGKDNKECQIDILWYYVC